MVVVDTNILVFLLLQGPQTGDARALLEKDPDWHSDQFILTELTNVLVTTMRVRSLELAAAITVLEGAQEIIGQKLHSASHAETLRLAQEHRTTAYDARFLAVAKALGARLVTEDAALRKAAPGLTQALSQALA